MIKLPKAWYRVSIKALIYDDIGRFLLCKESNGSYDLPGGGLDHGETPQEGLKRELFEEMGLELTWMNPTPKYFITAERTRSSKCPWVANICYEVKVKNLNFTSSEECVEIGFFTPEEAEKIPVFENIEALIKVMKSNK